MAGDEVNIKVCRPLKLRSGLTGNYHAICHYSYNLPLCFIKLIILMIKFFRKIRQKLISQNRFSKYLLYAVGEIVLVMIGILLALQVNNWNEQQKVKLHELNILNKLNEDLKANLLEVRIH